MTHLPRLMAAVLNKPHFVTESAGLAVLNAIMRGQVDMGAPSANRFVGDEQGEPTPWGVKSDGWTLAGQTGVVSVVGELVNRGAWVKANSGLVSYEGTTTVLTRMARDPRVANVIIDMNTPGGEASGMTDLAATVRAIAKEKPVVALCNAMMCSAGYGIASGATRIVTSETGVVGSIGVVWLHADYSEALAAEGIKITLFHEGKHKVDGNPFEALPAAVRAKIQAECAQFYGIFVDCVAAGRTSLTRAAIRATEARTYLGQEAVNAGLADDVGTFESVLADLASGATRLDSSIPRGSRAAAKPAATVAAIVSVPVRATTTDVPRGSAAATDPPEPRKDIPTMTDKTHTQADVDAAHAAGQTAGATAGAAAERTRISAILSSDEAKGRADMAAHIAFKTAMPAADGIAMLAAAPKTDVVAAAVETKPALTVMGLELATPTADPSTKKSTAVAMPSASEVYGRRNKSA